MRRLRGLDERLTVQPGHLLVGVLRIPENHGSPSRVITRRLAIALVLLLAAALVVFVDRSGYRDVRGEPLTFLDCLYFAAVSLSTTGYGDITPYSEAARLVNTVVFTPLRIAFLVVLVGTTLELLSERSRQGWKIQRWRNRVRNHTIVVGYGTKGKRAVAARVSDEAAQGEIVVVDTDRGGPRARRDGAGWSPCTATAPSPTYCGWPAPSTRRRSLSPPTAMMPPCWSP